MLDFLREEHVDEHIIKGIEDFRREHPSPEGALSARPRYVYYGKEVWEQAAEALLCGENLLLAGSKATGKNVLAENLAALIRTSLVQRIVPYQYGRVLYDRNRYLPGRTGSYSAPARSVSARFRAVSAYWTRSIWHAMKHWRSFTRSSTSAV